jgi:hypothetical protein
LSKERKRLRGAEYVTSKIKEERLPNLENGGYQRGVCAICGKPPIGVGKDKYLHVDHNHSTNKVRGLLCGWCNKMLGIYLEHKWLEKAQRYLEIHNV